MHREGVEMRILYYLAFLYGSLAFAEDTRVHTLRHVHLLFRHGDRSPISVFPTDGHPVYVSWPEGLGQLTQLGIEQHYLLGKWLRSRYENFLPKEYNESLLYMRSTDVDRTLMSAMANLAGLYTESNSSLTKYGLQWRPIPVHTVKHESEIMFASAPCPHFEELVNDSYETAETKEFLARHQDLFSLLSKVTGLMNVTFRNVWTVEDDLICLESHNLSLPTWLTPKIRAELKEVTDYFWHLRYNDVEMLRLEAGVFVNDAIQNMKFVINPELLPSSQVKSVHPKHIMAYSAHDDNVAAILGALGFYKNESKPKYSSLLIIELIGPDPPSPSSDFRVRVLYKRGWTDPMGEYLQFPACKSFPASEGCAFDKVTSQLEPILLTESEFQTACRTKRIVMTNSLFISLICFLLGSFIILGMIALSCLLYKRLIKRSTYHTFHNDENI